MVATKAKMWKQTLGQVVEEEVGDAELAAAEATRAALSMNPRYKLEMLMTSRRSTSKPFLGMLMLWRTGSSSAAVDTPLHLCPRCYQQVDEQTIGQFVVDNDGRMVRPYYGGVCLSCGHIWKMPEMVNSVYGFLPVQHWTDIIVDHIRLLGGDADVFIKYCRQDLLPAVGEYKRTPGYRQMLAMPAQLVDKELGVLTAERIAQDLHGGSSLSATVRAFLTA